MWLQAVYNEMNGPDKTKNKSQKLEVILLTGEGCCYKKTLIGMFVLLLFRSRSP